MGPMHTSVDIHSRHTNQMSFQNSSKAAATANLFNPCDLKGGQPDGANVARNPTLSSKRDAAPGLEARELSLHRSGPFFHFVVVSIFQAMGLPMVSGACKSSTQDVHHNQNDKSVAARC